MVMMLVPRNNLFGAKLIEIEPLTLFEIIVVIFLFFIINLDLIDVLNNAVPGRAKFSKRA